MAAEFGYGLGRGWLLVAGRGGAGVRGFVIVGGCYCQLSALAVNDGLLVGDALWVGRVGEIPAAVDGLSFRLCKRCQR